MIEKKEVTGISSFKYIREQLSRGKTLSSCINKLISIEQGLVYSYVPGETSEEHLFNFESGGLYHFNEELLKNKKPVIPIRNDSKPLVIREIKKHIENDANNCCIFEEPNAIPSDPWVAKSGIQYIRLDDNEMYYFFDFRNNVTKKLEEAYNVSDGYVFLCALSSLDSGGHNKCSPFQMIDVDLIESFTIKIAEFFLKAYDGEGYIKWQRIHS